MTDYTSGKTTKSDKQKESTTKADQKRRGKYHVSILISRVLSFLILQGGKGKVGQKDSYLQNLIKDRRVPGQKAVVCAFGDIKELTL